MAAFRWMLAALILGCGAKTTETPSSDAGTDSSVSDSGKDVGTPPDSAPIACVDSSGAMPISLKTCTSSADCAIRTRQSDCCGSEMVIGVRADVAEPFATCEAERRKGLPLCDCLSQPTRAEDGREISGFTVKVHCTDFTGSGGICKTYVE
jgi:hypothetical protein